MTKKGILFYFFPHRRSLCLFELWCFCKNARRQTRTNYTSAPHLLFWIMILAAQPQQLDTTHDARRVAEYDDGLSPSFFKIMLQCCMTRVLPERVVHVPMGTASSFHLNYISNTYVSNLFSILLRFEGSKSLTFGLSKKKNSVWIDIDP